MRSFSLTCEGNCEEIVLRVKIILNTKGDFIMAKTNGLFINFISEKMLHRQVNKADGREFYSVSVACPNSESRFGTIAVTVGQVFPATKNHGTEEVAGYKNVLLGAPEKMRKVSIKLADGSYTTVEMSNQDILNAFNAEREAYKAAQPAPAEEPAQ